jgi:MFS family permease
VYTFGVSLNRPVVVLGTMFIEKSKDPAVLAASDSWRYFILLPATFSIFCIIGTLFIVRYDTPMYLVTKRRFDEAKDAIAIMFNKDDDHEQVFKYLRKNTSKETDKASFKSAITDPRYRKGTLITSSLALILFFNGIFPITTFGGDLFTAIYGSDYSYFDSQQTLNIIAIADPLSQLLAVFIVPLFARRFFLIIGGVIIAALNGMIAFFDIANNNTAVTITVVTLVVVTSVMQEPVCQLYMQEVSSNSSLGIVHFCYYISTFLLAAALPTVLAHLGPTSIYGACCVMTVVLVVLQFFFVKETNKLTDKEKKMLYFPDEYRKKLTAGEMHDTSVSMDTDHSISFKV